MATYAVTSSVTATTSAFGLVQRMASTSLSESSVGASIYVSKLRESDGNVMKARMFTDLQLRWSPAYFHNMFGLALGVNNIFDTHIPGCDTCDLNNFDPTMYDLPGRFYYARLTVKY